MHSLPSVLPCAIILSLSAAPATWRLQRWGIGAWGLVTGVAMVKSGLGVASLSLAMTFLVFAGSAQLASLPLIIAGAPGLADLGHRHLRQPPLCDFQAPACAPISPTCL